MMQLLFTSFFPFFEEEDILFKITKIKHKYKDKQEFVQGKMYTNFTPIFVVERQEPRHRILVILDIHFTICTLIY